MNAKTLISVCLPTYNAELYISKSLQSIIDQQTDFEYEIIISDDASTDNTIEKVRSILNESKFENFRLLESEQNCGINSNLKKALTNCVGQFIAILDADDFWTDLKKLQRQFEILNSNKYLAYTYTNYIYGNTKGETGKTGLAENFQHPLKNQFEQQLLTPYICICTILIKKSILDFELLDEFINNHFISQDYPLLLEISKRYNGFYENKITTRVILKSNSISRPNSIEKKLAYFQNCFDIGTFFIRKYGIEQEIQDQRDFYFHLKVILLLWKIGDFNRIKDYAKKLKLKSFIRYQPRSIYIFYASKIKIFYNIIRYWTLRKRVPGS